MSHMDTSSSSSTLVTTAGGNQIIKLSYREKVPIGAMKDLLHDCLQERLTNQIYEGDKCLEASKQLADIIRNRLKNLGYDRYKYVVQVLIGERREQGLYYGNRCFWDSHTDNQASEHFTNDHIFCVATAYAIYLY
eukprot:gene4113-4508_t